MGISFLIVTITGIFKFPAVTDYLSFIFRIIPAPLMMQLHDWSGIAMALFVLLHLVFNWNWIVSVTKTILKRQK